MKLKTFFYNATIILPIISKIYNSIKFLVEFSKTNKEVLQARNDIINEIKYLQQVVHEINEFHHLNNTDEDEEF